MDLSTHEEHHNLYALLAAIVAAFVLSTGAGFLLETDERGDGPTPVVQRSAFEPDEPAIAQAPWKISSHPSAAFGKPSNKQLKAIRRVAPRVAATVRNVYDAIVVSRKQLRAATRRWMTQLAARELRRTPPIPSTLTGVETTRRRASIGIDIRTRNRAAAEVEIAFRARRGDKPLRFVHRGTLWLERGAKGWRVIAFEILQRRRA